MSINSVTPLLSSEVILQKISEITLQIQQHKELESILQWAIADARALLHTDRVLIYRFLENQDTVVAFESVNTEWSSILGQPIDHPCFDATWVERCQQGQITTISDIHSETIDSFHLLEQFEVQAILGVPIFSQGSLWGLLTVHHCQSPREWQPLEVQLLKHIALQLGLAIQQAELHQHQQHLIDSCADIHDRKQKQELIQTIAQGISAKTGEAFFHSLVHYLIHLLGIEQAFVGELIAPETNQIKIIAGLDHEQVLDGVEYSLADTPCEQVVRQGFCSYPDNIQQCFPKDIKLQTLGVEGYVGIPLMNSSEAVIGLISVISNQALTNVQFIQEILTIFAVRAAFELERQQSEAMLRRYERIVSATPDMVSLIDRNYLYQVVNQSYLIWNQKSYDEIVGHSISDLLGQEFFETVSKPLVDRCFAGESQQSFDAWQTYADGQRRYIRATYAPYVELDGTISGVVINVHDLTDLKLVEEAFRESEERFRQMASSIYEVFWMTDIDFTQIIYVSPGYEEIWGRSCASLYEQPRSFLESIHQEDRAQVLAIIEQQRSTRFSHEYRLLRPDGTIRWIWERTFPVTDAAGHPYRLVGVSQDITDRKAAEIALTESQRHYQTLVDNSPDIIERFDRQLRHLYVSPSLTKITGIPAEVFLGKTCRDLEMDERMVNAWEVAASALLATGQKQAFEFETPTLQGIRSFEMVVVPELSDRQLIESILCISRDVTDRKAAETALQQLNQKLEQRVQERTQSLHQQAEQERLMRLIIQNIHRSLDLEETLTAVLNETRHTFKADRVTIYQFNPDWSGSFIAESVGEGWAPLVLPDNQKVWQDTHFQDTQGGHYQNNETFAVNDIYTIGHKQCHIDLLEQFQARAYAIAPIFLDEQLWGLLAVYQNSGSRDWQEWEVNLVQQIGIRTAIALRQSHLYQAAQAQVKELERLNQLKDDFLSTVSHELRSPMSSIKMAIQMLEIGLKPLGVLEDETNAINRYLRILREEGNREVNLINNLLDLSRLDAGTEMLDFTTIDLQFYIPDLAAPFIERTHQHQQQLVIHIPDDLPPFTTDVPSLERILTELLHNACKYTPAGETITVSAQSNSAALEIRVSNTGVEIPAAECDRIFDKFYRIPNNDPWKHGGTGLGLALVKKLTERLGGDIYVESGCRQTTFILKFCNKS